MSDIDRAFSVCGYCFQAIPDGEDGYLKGGVITSAEGYAPDEFRGRGVLIARPDGTMIGCILAADSELAAEGFNFSLFVCSKDCARGAELFLGLASPVSIGALPEETVPKTETRANRKRRWRLF